MEEFHNSEPPENHQTAAPSSSSITTSIGDSNALALLRSFPAELIHEILLRLPVKSLLKFKCVSRSWRSLISSPRFVKAHFEISSSKPNLLIWSIFQGRYYLRQCSVNTLFYDQTSDGIDLDYPIRRNDWYVSYVGDYNGLICLCFGRKNLILWNPSLRKSNKFPILDVGLHRDVNPHYLVSGFGYDEGKDDYVVVCVVCLRGYLDLPCGEAKVYVCSIKSPSWRRIGSFEGGHPWDSGRGLFHNGKIHWTLEKKNSGRIITLDLATETYGTIEEPKYEKGPGKLGVFDGCLCLLGFQKAAMADVWVMKEYPVKESWTKLLTIPCNPMRSFMSTPLCMSQNGKLSMIFGRELGLYNPEINAFEQVKGFFGTIYTASLFVESLFFPRAG